MRFFLISSLAFLFFSGSSYASSFSYRIEGVTAGEARALQPFLQDAESRLPEVEKNGIDAPVTIRFENLDGIPELSSCEAHIFGKTARTALGGFRRPYTVYLHSGFKDEILKGEDRATASACGHKNLYRLALATVLHETTHIYDGNPKLLTDQDRATIDACELEIRSRQKRGGLDPLCDSLLHLQNFVSGKISFIRLMGFEGSQGSYDSKNHLQKRSPDPYETTNPAESFAVNMEYFLLDPEFACRRPAVFRFYREHFGVDPFPNRTCRADTYALSTISGLAADLDPSRLYQIHYLFAGKGSDMSSRWGHAMIRLVFCAPSRKQVGPDCLGDLAFHVVVSYRANPGDTKISYLKGLSGDYPSQIFLYTMNQVIDDYTRGEGRELISLPLNFSEEQKRFMLEHILEQLWGYSGRYYFLSNNCATETEQQIQSAIDPYHPFLKTAAATPLGLYDHLIQTGLADASPVADRARAIRAGYYFASGNETLDRSFQSIASAASTQFKNRETYLTKSTGDERAQLFASAMQAGSARPDEQRRLAAAFYLLEMQERRLFQQDLQADLALRLEASNLGTLLKDVLKTQDSLTPWNLVRDGAGYGIPFRTELVSDEEISNRLKTYFGALKTAEAWVRENSTAAFQERNAAIENNLRTFRMALKAP